MRMARGACGDATDVVATGTLPLLRGPSNCYGDPPIAVVQPRAMVDVRASHRE